MKLGPLHVRDDEEPDLDERHTIPLDRYLDCVRGLCGFCGHSDHRRDKCPHIPRGY
jgi:hypothetical protein